MGKLVPYAMAGYLGAHLPTMDKRLGPITEHVSGAPSPSRSATNAVHQAQHSERVTQIALKGKTALPAPGDGDQDVLSPVTKMVTRSRLKNPEVAVVHKVLLNDLPPIRVDNRRRNSTPAAFLSSSSQAETGHLIPDDLLHSGAASRDPSSESQTRRPSLARSDSSVGKEPLLRPLTSDEVAKRNASAVDYFKSAQGINRRARSKEEVEAALAAARHRRENYLLRVRLGIADHEDGAEHAAEHPPAEEIPAVVVTEAMAPRKSLAEKFGYGVIPKQPVASALLKAGTSMEGAPPPPVKHTIRGSFAEVKAGKNDLLQRLAKRHLTIE